MAAATDGPGYCCIPMTRHRPPEPAQAKDPTEPAPCWEKADTSEQLRALRGPCGESGQRPRHAGLHLGDRCRARRILHGPGPGFLVCHGDSLPRGFQRAKP
ncbi:hypothetical protein EJB05_51259, partial [Eragrostis curvula]